jgi:anaerobic C4-dicarboxylate transporter DcuA
MTLKLIREFAVVPGVLLVGARAGGVSPGLGGAVGMLVLGVGFGVPPGAIPGEVLIIVLTVIMAASAMDVSGGAGFGLAIAKVFF